MRDAYGGQTGSGILETEKRYRRFAGQPTRSLRSLGLELPVLTQLPFKQLQCFCNHPGLAGCDDAMARMHGLKSAEARSGNVMPRRVSATGGGGGSSACLGYGLAESRVRGLDTGDHAGYVLSGPAAMVREPS